MAEKKTFTTKEVATHNSNKSSWIIIHNQVSSIHFALLRFLIKNVLHKCFNHSLKVIHKPDNDKEYFPLVIILEQL